MAVPIAAAFSQLDWNSAVDGLVYDGPLVQEASIVNETSSASKLPEPGSLEMTWLSPGVISNSDGPLVEEDLLGVEPLSNPVQENGCYVPNSSNILLEPASIHNELPSFTQSPAFRDLVSATIKFARQHALPTSFRLNSLILPNPYKNLLHCPQTRTLIAYFHNAQCMGMESQDLLNHRSPFYRPGTTMADDAQALLTVARKPWIPLHLQPTLPQILIPHHPYIDLIPFPGLRSRAITLAATMPQLFNPMELKLDIFKEGMFYLRQDDWNKPPWDARSWQVAPWFVTKWKLLLD